MTDGLWGCQICGNDSFSMSRADHGELHCAERWAEWNRQQFARLDPRLTAGFTPPE